MSEESEARRFGGVLQKNSGRGRHQKGDAIKGIFCVDIKEYAESFGVSRKNWAKLSSDALQTGRKIPAFYLALGTDEPKLRLWVIDDNIFQEMYEAWSEKYDRQD